MRKFESSSRAESLGEFRFRNAEVRIPPPQPASPSLTHTESSQHSWPRLQNRRHHRSPALAIEPAGQDPGRAHDPQPCRNSDALFARGKPVISGKYCCWFAAQPSMKDLGNGCGTRARAKMSQGNKRSLNRRDIGADLQRIGEFEGKRLNLLLGLIPQGTTIAYLSGPSNAKCRHVPAFRAGPDSVRVTKTARYPNVAEPLATASRCRKARVQ